MNFPHSFIAATREFSTYEKHIPAPYFRKTFTLTEVPQSAKLLICGLGFYELHVNGKDVTKGKLAPYISNPDDVVYYDAYDLTGSLKTGANVLAIQLGNGFQNNPGGEVWDFDQAKWRAAPKLALSLDVTFPDGAPLHLESDETFRTAPSPMIFDDLRLGVAYDAARELPGWDTAAYNDSAWTPALSVEQPRGEAVLCAIDPIVVAREFAPVRVEKMTVPTANLAQAKGKFAPEQLGSAETEGYLYDFGTNQSGLCRLKIRGEKGQKLTFWFGEVLKNGKYLHSNVFVRPNCLETLYQRMEYTCKGGEEEIFEPNFTFFGYQYAFVTGLTDAQATPELLTYLEMHSKLEERGGFHCSDPVLNKLQEMARRSTVSNFFYFPSDCPHREKNGWTADASLSAEQALLNLNPEQYYAEWLRSIRKAQNEAGALPGIVPTGGWGFAWGNGPAWDNVLLNLPYFVYQYRGDPQILRDNAEAIWRYVHYLTTRMDEKGLIAIGLGDWCAPGQKGPKSPLIFTDSVMSLDICRKAAYIFGELHMTAQQRFCTEIADGLRCAIRKYLIDFSTMTVIGNCQTSQAMAIFYDVLEPGEKQQAFAVLLDMLADCSNHVDTGVLGIRVLFHVLSDFGCTDLAVALLDEPTAPSYGNWVAEGYSTMRESMDPVTEDAIPSSVNHHFFSDISSWFIQSLAGIRVNPFGNQLHEVNICPHFAEQLTEASGYHITVDGKVSSTWTRDADGLLLTLEVPDGAFGEIRLEQGFTFENGRSVQPLKSGTMRIVVR